MGEPEHFNEGVTAYLHPRLLLRVVVKSLLVLKESNCSPAGYWEKKKSLGSGGLGFLPVLPRGPASQPLGLRLPCYQRQAGGGSLPKLL